MEWVKWSTNLLQLGLIDYSRDLGQMLDDIPCMIATCWGLGLVVTKQRVEGIVLYFKGKLIGFTKIIHQNPHWQKRFNSIRLRLFQVNLKGCEVTPEINLSQHKYQIKLEIPSAEGMTEMWLRLTSVSCRILIEDNLFDKCKSLNQTTGPVPPHFTKNVAYIGILAHWKR